MDRYVRRHQSSGRYDDDDNGPGNLRRLERERNNNDQKLQARFEHIFRKYEHDFTGVGDEIDIASGDIVVNNGHLQYMRHEVDPGKSASSSFVRTFQNKLEQEDTGLAEDIGFYELGENGLDSEEDEEQNVSDENGNFALPAASAVPTKHARSSHQHPFGTPRDLQPPALSQAFGELKRPAPRLARILVDEGSPQRPVVWRSELDRDDTSSIGSTSRTTTPASNLLERVPGIQESMRALKWTGKRSAADSDTLQALGVSIANQLAQLMTEPIRKKNRGKSFRPSRSDQQDSVWDYPELTEREVRQKRRRSPSPLAQHLTSSPRTHSPGQESLWAPESSVRNFKRRKTRDEVMSLYHDGTPTPVVADQQVLQWTASCSGQSAVRRCWNCSLTNNSSWHRGPHGQDLCLSCAKYYWYHRRMKPFDSPTPSIGEDKDRETATTELAGRLSNNYEAIDHPDGEHAKVDQIEPDQPKDTCVASNVLKNTQQSDGKKEAPMHNTSEAATGMPVFEYVANMSRPIAVTPSPAYRQTQWTLHEDALLIRLKEKERLPWERIAPHFPDRSLFAIQARYSNKLHGGLNPGRKFLLHHPDRVPRMRNKSIDAALESDHAWNREQDELLLKLRQDRGLAWSEIADLLPRHTAQAVERRSSLLTEAALSRRNSAMFKDDRADTGVSTPAQGSQTRDRFSAEEDALIVRLKEVEGLPWSSIVQHFPGRPLSSIQKRYSSRLAPEKRKVTPTVTYDPVKGTVEDRILAVDPELAGPGSAKHFDPAEDDMIKSLKEKQNLAWNDIAQILPGRTANAIQHRYEYKFATPRSSRSSATLETLTQFDTPGIRQMRSQSDEQGNQKGVFKLEGYKWPKRAKTVSESALHLSPAPDPTISSAHQQRPATAATPTITHTASDCAVPARLGPGSRKPFSQAEDDWILRAKEQEGHGWEDIALSLPGRSIRSITTRYIEVLRPPGQDAVQTLACSSEGRPPSNASSNPAFRWKSQKGPSSALSSTRASANPLLRKALDNSLRRRSDQALHISTTSTQVPEPLHDGRNDIDADETNDSEQSFKDRPCEVNVSSLADQKGAPSASRPREKRAERSDCRFSELPDRLQQAATKLAAQQENLGLIGSVTQIYHNYGTDPRLQHVMNVAVNDSASIEHAPAPSEHFEAGEPSMTPLKETEFQVDVNSADAANSIALALVDDDMPLAHAQHSGRNASNNSNHLTTGSEARTISKATRKLNNFQPPLNVTPIISPRRTRSTARQTGANVSRASPVSDQPTPAARPCSATRDLLADDPLVDPRRRSLSFSELVRLAFETTGSAVMQCKDICDWIETNHKVQGLSPLSWKARVRAELSANPSFSRTATEVGVTTWQLVDGAKSHTSWRTTRESKRGREQCSWQSAIKNTAAGSAIGERHDEPIAVSMAKPPNSEPLRLEAVKPVDQISRLADIEIRKEHRTARPGQSPYPSATLGPKKSDMPKQVGVLQAMIKNSDSDDDGHDLCGDMERGELLRSTTSLTGPKQLSSDVNRDPKSALISLADRRERHVSSPTVTTTAVSRRSSSRSFVCPTTPPTSSSKPQTLRNQPLRVSLSSRGTPGAIFVSRFSAGSTSTRSVEMPVREVDSDEDELA